jgi:hypothetical protein
MKRAIWVAPFAALLMSGCADDGSDGIDGTNGADGLSSLVATQTIPRGDAECAGGGQLLASGLDSNRNGVLEEGEVSKREYLQCLTSPKLRALHASPDAPAVNIRVDGKAVLSNVGYTQGSGFLDAGERTRVEVEAIVPGGNAVVIDESLELEFSTEYTVIAAGNVSAPVAAWIIENPAGEPIAEGSARAQVVHAAPSAPAVDVYVTAPGADLASSTPINEGALGFHDATARAVVPAGDYQIRVTAAGDSLSLVFDSGTISLPAGADLMIVAVENTGPGATPIQLVALDGTSTAALLDVNTPASVLAVHASPDAPPVDVLADSSSTTDNEALPLARGVEFPAACMIPTVPAGEYEVSITAAGDPSTIALQFDLAPEPGDEVAAIVSGYLGSTPAIQTIALMSDTRSVATEAKLRITHASPGTGAVDLYLLPDGTDLNASSTAPSFAAVPFGADTGVLSIAPGTYDVYVTPAGSKSVVAIEVADLALAGGDVLDIMARDAELDGSEGALPKLIVLDYSVVSDCST